VSYGDALNTGAEINVGLDIIKTLSEHYGIKAPVFIDHAESISEILDPGMQVIKLRACKLFICENKHIHEEYYEVDKKGNKVQKCPECGSEELKEYRELGVVNE